MIIIPGPPSLATIYKVMPRSHFNMRFARLSLRYSFTKIDSLNYPQVEKIFLNSRYISEVEQYMLRDNATPLLRLLCHKLIPEAIFAHGVPRLQSLLTHPTPSQVVHLHAVNVLALMRQQRFQEAQQEHKKYFGAAEGGTEEVLSTLLETSLRLGEECLDWGDKEGAMNCLKGALSITTNSMAAQKGGSRRLCMVIAKAQYGMAELSMLEREVEKALKYSVASMGHWEQLERETVSREADYYRNLRLLVKCNLLVGDKREAVGRADTFLLNFGEEPCAEQIDEQHFEGSLALYFLNVLAEHSPKSQQMNLQGLLISLLQEYQKDHSVEAFATAVELAEIDLGRLNALQQPLSTTADAPQNSKQ